MHHRTDSNSSAAIQRNNLVAELDNPNLVAGVPEHDFTAGANISGQGMYDHYNNDPYARAEAYEYDPSYYQQQGAYGHHQAAYDQPTQDTAEGYADLQRGNSIGSGSGHTHGEQIQLENFPMPEQYLGRPTGGADGPYAQAQYGSRF